jgi:deoxyribose-phosphate aldolase
MTLTRSQLAGFIEHTLLRINTTDTDIRHLCAQAIEHRFYSVVVNPVWIRTASSELTGTPIKVVAVAGFPLGANRTDIKVAEACESAEDGAHEIDLVANIGWLVSNRYLDVEAELRKVRRHLPKAIVLKVIVEAGRLSDKQAQEAAKVVFNSGAQYVKTGTGFFGGVTVQQVQTLASVTQGRIGIKAAGGIRTLADCRALLEAGATRLGCSSSIEILREFDQL